MSRRTIIAILCIIAGILLVVFTAGCAVTQTDDGRIVAGLTLGESDLATSRIDPEPVTDNMQAHLDALYGLEAQRTPNVRRQAMPSGDADQAWLDGLFETQATPDQDIDPEELANVIADQVVARQAQNDSQAVIADTARGAGNLAGQVAGEIAGRAAGFIPEPIANMAVAVLSLLGIRSAGTAGLRYGQSRREIERERNRMIGFAEGAGVQRADQGASVAGGSSSRVGPVNTHGRAAA